MIFECEEIMLICSYNIVFSETWQVLIFLQPDGLYIPFKIFSFNWPYVAKGKFSSCGELKSVGKVES